MLHDPHVNPKHVFHFELQPSYDVVRAHIRNCEGRHVQQAIFSTFMDTLTQICFTCQRIRSTIDWDGNRSWPAFAQPWIPSPEEAARLREDLDVVLAKVNPEEECGA